MITKEYIEFFKGLEKNNNREWFHAHQQEYEKFVKGPFVRLVEQLIPEIETFEPGFSPDPNDALFRINRDLRFTKDKTPYNTLMKAGFALGGKKSVLPGYYLGIDKESIYAGGGLFNLNTSTLKRIRALIAEETDEFIEITTNRSFLDMFKELRGERAHRVNGSLKSLEEKTPYVANKQFYAMAELSLVDYLNSDSLSRQILPYFRAIRPLNNYLKKAFVKYDF